MEHEPSQESSQSGDIQAAPSESASAETVEEQPLADSIRTLPEEPGVYLFHDSRGKVLYVGKAKSLRDRVRSYIGAAAAEVPKTRALMKRAHKVDYIVTRTEVEALILECNLIKEYRPRYNIRLRDDKKYPYLRITVDHFPRVFVTRTVVHDGSEYFGPYSDVGAMRRTLALLQRVFQTRPCTPESLEGIDRPCLYYDIKMCGAPCVGLQTRDEYAEVVAHVRLFLGGRTQELLTRIRERMQHASEDLNFEQAARFRDQMHAIERSTDRMRSVLNDAIDRDALALRRDGSLACGLVMKIRGGRLMTSETFYLKDRDEVDSEIFAAFFQQYFNATTSIPQEILVSSDLEDKDLLQTWLSDKSGHRVAVTRPHRGEKNTLIQLALKNASLKLDEWAITQGKAQKHVPEAVTDLREALQMSRLPRRIECFDISNFQGSHPVASLVHFDNAEPFKGRYRHFRIRGIAAPNDFAMMEHVVERHYGRLSAQGADLPELVMVDGGRGQLGSARKALDRLGLGDRVTLIGLAKKQEEIWKFGSLQSILLPRTSEALKLLQRIRNEAHRFAIGYHRRLRGQELVRSALDDIPGVGHKTRIALLRHFGSIDAIGRANANQLATIPGIGTVTAERILSVLTHPALHSGATNAELESLDDRIAPAPTAPAEVPDTAADLETNAAPASQDDDLEAEEIDIDVDVLLESEAGAPTASAPTGTASSTVQEDGNRHE